MNKKDIAAEIKIQRKFIKNYENSILFSKKEINVLQARKDKLK